MLLRETGYDVKVAAMVASRFRDSRLYYVHHHPTGELFNYMLCQILISEKFRSVHNKGLTSLIDGVGRWSVESRVFTDEQMPINPDVARFFNLSWWHPDMRYRMIGREWTYDEWMEYYMSENLPEQGAAIA